MSDQSREKDALEHAWRYFALHATQRMSMFNFFIVASGAALAGLSGCLHSDGALLLAGVAVGVAVAVLAYVFWKLDKRTAFLIKHAEAAMCYAECALFTEKCRLFDSEAEKTLTNQATKSGAERIWTYRKAFACVFVLVGCLGVGGAVLSTALYVASRDKTATASSSARLTTAVSPASAHAMHR